jgi:nucleolar complex protein 2
MAAAGDEVMLDLCLKGAYHGIVRNTKSTTIYNIDSINLMKNSASELYSLNLVSSYQQAFGFIRQLAIHLRNCLKTKSAESYQAVYNWQYTHCLDFWSIVLSATCDKEKGDGESIMQPLIYPLVQAATGSIRLIPTSRYFPLRFHVIQSLLRLMQRTGAYVPLAPLLLEMLESTEFTRKSKPSTLSTLDFSTLIRIPKAYVRTKVYADQIVEETVYFLLEFLNLFSKSIAFPELVVPITMTLKRVVKTSKSSRDVNNAKLVSSIKSLLEKMQRQSEFLVEKRNRVEFAPKDVHQVASFLAKSSVESPIEAATRLARKVRLEKKALLQQQTQKIVEDQDD